MKVSTKGTYALKVMMDIAIFSKEKNVSISDIALRNNLSEKYLEKIIAGLVKANLLTSSRGAQDGYRLNREPKDIKLGEIMHATEGQLKSVSCLENGGKCNMANMCASVKVWAKLDSIVNDFFDKTSLEDCLNGNFD